VKEISSVSREMAVMKSRDVVMGRKANQASTLYLLKVMLDSWIECVHLSMTFLFYSSFAETDYCIYPEDLPESTSTAGAGDETSTTTTGESTASTTTNESSTDVVSSPVVVVGLSPSAPAPTSDSTSETTSPSSSPQPSLETTDQPSDSPQPSFETTNQPSETDSPTSSPQPSFDSTDQPSESEFRPTLDTIDKPTSTGDSEPTELPRFQAKGKDYCTKDDPCPLCHGDCDVSTSRRDESCAMLDVLTLTNVPFPFVRLAFINF
jgi:hypothetical protein